MSIFNYFFILAYLFEFMTKQDSTVGDVSKNIPAVVFVLVPKPTSFAALP